VPLSPHPPPPPPPRRASFLLPAQVCDFGLSRKVPDVRFFKQTGDIYRVPFSRICGTGGFIPPEIIRKQPFGKPTDMWAVGVICYRILAGTLPFIPPTKCLDQPVRFQGRAWEGISKDAQHFIARLLTPDQNKRATAREALGHRWLQTVPEWGPTPGLPSSGPSSTGRGAAGKGSGKENVGEKRSGEVVVGAEA
jgi:serine/threonine protein kinase